MRQWIKKILHRGKNQKGFSLVEALVATAIMGVGFVGSYTMVVVSENAMRKSAIKQKLQMQANQIFEIIESDKDNVDNYDMSLETCTALSGSETEKYEIRKYEWCSRMAGEVGTAGSGDTRSISVSTLGTGQKVVEILLEALDGDVQIIIKRVFDD